MTQHNLEPLWAEAKQILAEIEPESASSLTETEGVIKQLNEHDPSSFVFRYPKDKKGQVSLDPELKMINLVGLSERVRGAMMLLDGATCQIEWLRDSSSDYGR